MTTLETRRLRGDQIEVFMILNGYENIDSNIFFEIKKGAIQVLRNADGGGRVSDFLGKNVTNTVQTAGSTV